MAREPKRSSGEGWGMVKRCVTCGREARDCACPARPAAALPPEKQRPRYRFERRRGKPVTVITHLALSEVDLKALASDLKSRLGAGGTVEEGEIVLQGDRREALPALLAQKGFRV
jgi:translation initiation factor 1